MNRSMTLIVMLVVITGCTTRVYTAHYDIDLLTVARQESGGEARRFTNLHGHTFEDEFIRITWTPFETQLGMILVNKTTAPERVIWKEVAYIDPNGRSDKVIHEGVNPSVAPGDTLLDLLEPTGRGAPLIGFTRGTSAGAVRAKMVHGNIEVLLPVEINGLTRNYRFRFGVKGNVVMSGWSS